MLSHQPFDEVGNKPILLNPTESVFGTLEVRVLTDSSRHSRAALRDSSLSRFVRRLYQLLVGKNEVAGRWAPDFLGKTGAGSSILIVGGGTRGEGTASLWASTEIVRVSFDVYASPNIQFVADAHAIPIRDGSVDGVWIQAILEHVVDPVKVVAEIHRVLKPGGLVYAETPFMQQVHEGAFDFFRFTHSAHRLLFRRFEEIASGQVMGAGTVLIWSIRYFVRAVAGSDMLGRLAALPFFWLRFFDKVGPARSRLDSASGVFFYGKKSGVELSLKDLDKYYRDAGRA